MKTTIALLRGINVGGRHSLPMKELVAILEALGYQDVQTYIQSGNVVFRSENDIGPDAAGDISAAIMAAKGFEPCVMLLSDAQLQAAIDHNPYVTDEGKALHFYFLDSEAPDADLDKLDGLKKDSEQYTLMGDVFYLYAPDGIGRSKLAAVVEQVLGVPATARNWNTVRKLASMLESG